MKLSAFGFLALAGLAASAPALSKPKTDSDVDNVLNKFSNAVVDFSKKSDLIIKAYPLPPPSKEGAGKDGKTTPSYNTYNGLIAKSLTDHINIRDYQSRLAGYKAQSDNFFNNYAGPMSDDQWTQKTKVDRNAKTELGALRRWLEQDMSTTLPPAVFDEDLGEFMERYKKDQKRVSLTPSEVENWLNVHRNNRLNIIQFKKSYRSKLLPHEQNTEIGSELLDEISVETSRVAAADRALENLKSEKGRKTQRPEEDEEQEDE